MAPMLEEETVWPQDVEPITQPHSLKHRLLNVSKASLFKFAPVLSGLGGEL